ncbi:hypothetical protein EG347_09400 [Chryseobacterium sp. G0186]|nr:hypothetical protein EG347_09400 [Chryseobacterium sp. G0186]
MYIKQNSSEHSGGAIKKWEY